MIWSFLGDGNLNTPRPHGLDDPTPHFQRRLQGLGIADGQNLKRRCYPGGIDQYGRAGAADLQRW